MHTPTPWRITTHSSLMIMKELGGYVADTKEAEENAAFIVHCVNNHYKLVKALQDLIIKADETGFDFGDKGRIAQARHALSQANAQQQEKTK